jgi:adenylate cyclase
LAARLEKLTGKLGRTILTSSAFAHLCPLPLQAMGEFSLAGFAKSEMVFAPATGAQA